MKKSRHLTSISGSRNETLARLLRCLQGSATIPHFAHTCVSLQTPVKDSVHLKMQVRESVASHEPALLTGCLAVDSMRHGKQEM